jgi:hypothetical protein
MHAAYGSYRAEHKPSRVRQSNRSAGPCTAATGPEPDCTDRAGARGHPWTSRLKPEACGVEFGHVAAGSQSSATDRHRRCPVDIAVISIIYLTLSAVKY